MIRYTPGYAPKATNGEKAPTAATAAAAAAAASASKSAIDAAKALATARQTQVLDYSRKATTPQPLKVNLRMDGPTLEQWIGAGYLPENYPPNGYAELPSHALSEYKAKLLAASEAEKATPKSVNDQPEVHT